MRGDKYTSVLPAGDWDFKDMGDKQEDLPVSPSVRGGNRRETPLFIILGLKKFNALRVFVCSDLFSILGACNFPKANVVVKL